MVCRNMALFTKYWKDIILLYRRVNSGSLAALVRESIESFLSYNRITFNT